MKIAIMQPYFLPYIGYFQLMAAVDKFVILDDVNFINRGWINRNRLLLHNKISWMTIPLTEASQNKTIRDIHIQPDGGWKRKLLQTVNHSYCRAGNMQLIFPLFESLIDRASGNLSDFLCSVLVDIHKLLALECHIVPSSSIFIKSGLSGAERILDICVKEHASHYINPIGGMNLYEADQFSKENIQLQFLESSIPHLEIGNMQTGDLSLIHLLMFMDMPLLKRQIHDFKLK
jgi:hypothetical protein